jgi:hypothetical protein
MCIPWTGDIFNEEGLGFRVGRVVNTVSLAPQKSSQSKDASTNQDALARFGSYLDPWSHKLNGSISA